MKNTAYRGDLSAPRELTPFKPSSAVAPAGTPGAAASSIDPVSVTLQLSQDSTSLAK